jgi:hypothetical protein
MYVGSVSHTFYQLNTIFDPCQIRVPIASERYKRNDITMKLAVFRHSIKLKTSFAVSNSILERILWILNHCLTARFCVGRLLKRFGSLIVQNY